MRSSPLQIVFVNSTTNTFTYYLEGGLEDLRRRIETIRKSVFKTSFHFRDVPRKSTDTRQSWKNARRLPLIPDLLCVFGDVGSSFLVLSALPCFCTFTSPSLTEVKFYRNLFSSCKINDQPVGERVTNSGILLSFQWYKHGKPFFVIFHVIELRFLCNPEDTSLVVYP